MSCGPATVLRYFQKKILHVHAVAADGRSYLSDSGSVAVRYEALQRLRTEKKTLEQLGAAFASVSGREDRFILDELDLGADTKVVAKKFIEAVRAKL